MEFARRIGELAHLTRRLNRVQADRLRAQRLLASPRLASPTTVSATASSLIHSNATDDKENVDGRLSLAYRRQRRAEEMSREAQTRGGRIQDQLLLRRIPVAVSLVERSLCKLDLRRRERDGKRLRLPEHTAPSPYTFGEELLEREDTASTTIVPLSPDEKGNDLNNSGSVVDTSDPFSNGTRGSWSLQLLSGDRVVAPLSRSPATPATRQQVEAMYLLLQLLHSVEQARRQHLKDKQNSAQHRCDVAESTWQNFQKEFRSQLHKRRSIAKHQTSNSPLSREDEALLRETAETLRQRRRSAREDLALLQSSLLTRPFVSARLWGLLLREPVWTAAVREHKRAVAVSTEQPASISHSKDLDVSRLLFFCLALTRISIGILRDYVQGGQLSRRAPRFVVSPPSRTFRARITHHDEDNAGEESADSKQQKKTKDTESLNQMERISDNSSVATSAADVDNGDSDLLFSMLQSAIDTSAATSSQSLDVTDPRAALLNTHRHSSNGTLTMRWIPPHTAEVIPLVTDTLALHSLVLPEMEISVLLDMGCAPELLSLCVTLQRIASMTLALAQDDGETNNHHSRSSPLHRTLHALENALATVGTGVVDRLIAECQAPAQEVQGGAAVVVGRERLLPADAARLVVQLHSLHLLPAGDARVAQLLTKLLTDIFPELRTQTSSVLHEKARQSSLLAFATRPHRQKLYQQHGPKHAQKYLLETVVQQARLQQRQLSAALREQHLNEVHVRALRELGQSLPPNDLVQLFQLYTRYSSEMTERPHTSAVDSDVWVTGCLFLAEAILLSHSASSVLPRYSLSELATLWNAATILFPHIRTRRARQLAHQRATAPGRSRAFPTASTEHIIWATFAEQILAGINAVLAERLQTLEIQRRAESTAMRRSCVQKQTQFLIGKHSAHNNDLADQSVSINAVIALAAGVLEYASHDTALRDLSSGVAWDGCRNSHTSSSLQPIQQSVRVLSRLLHELMLHDRPLWHQVRRLPVAQRDAVERHLRECFHSLGLLDDTTMSALSAMNREDNVPV